MPYNKGNIEKMIAFLVGIQNGTKVKILSVGKAKVAYQNTF